MDLGSWMATYVTSGIIGGFIGAFLGGFAKFFWERFLPDWLTWRRQYAQESQRILATYRDPMLRAAGDLQGRLWNIIRKGGLGYMGAVGEGQYATDSTLYVVAQYFAWAEILGQRIRLLNYRELSRALRVTSETIAAGHNGIRVFRLQQREIGERMLAGEGAEPRVLSYSEFLDRLGQTPPSPLSKSLEPARRAIEALQRGETDRKALIPIQHALIDLIICIDDPRHPWIPPDRRQKV
jgi:hypothetical protein